MRGGNDLMRLVWTLASGELSPSAACTSRVSHWCRHHHCCTWQGPRSRRMSALAARAPESEERTSRPEEDERMAMAVAEELEESARRAAREWREKGGLPAESGEANAESWQDVAARNSEAAELKQQSPAKRKPATLVHKARLYEDDEHNIRGVQIPRSAWTVLLRLRAAGHEGYIVGGAVRDLLLKGVPKDFDILTSATVGQAKKLLHRSRIIGRRFPIIQVDIGGDVLEVSSFSTGVALLDLPYDAARLLSSKNAQLGSQNSKQGHALLWKIARQQNAEARDFTVNALMYDPFSRIIFDYTDGVSDIRRQVLRTIVDPEKSFKQDPARMLRAVRHAARAGLRIEDGVAKTITKCCDLITELPSGRVAMEVQSLLAVGAAEASMKLLWKLGLLDLVFPILANYLERRGYPRNPRKARQEVLFSRLEKLDEVASPDHPISPGLWLAVLTSPVIEELAALSSEGRQAAYKSAGIQSRHDRDTLGGSDSDREAEAFGDEGEADTFPEMESNRGNLTPYLQVALDVVDAFIDGPKTPGVPRASRHSSMKLLEIEESCRKQKELTLKCNGCGRMEKVQIDDSSMPRCSECGAKLHSKLLKRRRAHDAKLIIDILS